VADGWRIEHTEVPDERHGDVVFEVDGEPFFLRGRIDRIDVHAATGRRAVLDYKTSDAGEPPDKTHRRSGRWMDLQLPLYRHFARGMGLGEECQLGYVSLPKDTNRVGFQLATWTAAELAAADDVARDVIRRIRRQDFWPPADPPPPFSDDLAPICQDLAFEKERPVESLPRGQG
jgi:RecB family exonuclease